MAVKKVWLFASFPTFSGHLVKEFDPALTNLGASSMTGRESFACYRDGDGNVIALDKTGFCVTE
jgi:hypothetical protein